MKFVDKLHNGLPVALLVAIGGIALLPLALDALNGLKKSQLAERSPRVTLTCFDREMRANPCNVVTPRIAIQTTVPEAR